MRENGPVGPAALEAFALDPLALQLPGAANGFGLFTGTALRRLFIGTAQLHFAEDAFTLHLLLQGFEGLIHVVISNNDLHGKLTLLILKSTKQIGPVLSPVREDGLLSHQNRVVKEQTYDF